MFEFWYLSLWHTETQFEPFIEIRDLIHVVAVVTILFVSFPRLLLILFLNHVSFINVLAILRTDKNWSFPSRISSVNMTKYAGNCGFGHIYWRNPSWKTSFFAQWRKQTMFLFPFTSLKKTWSPNFCCSFALSDFFE